MSRFRIVVLTAFAILFGGALRAQTTSALPACFTGTADASVGVPYYCDFGVALNQFLTPYLPYSGISLTLTFNVTKGSTLPPGISPTPGGVLSGTPTTAGTFTFSIDVSVTITVSGQTFNETVPLQTALQVTGSTTGPTLIEPGGLVFAMNQGSAASSESIALFSRRSTPITYTTTVSTASGGNWLSVTANGTVNPFQSTTATATVNPAGLQPGTYTGTISFALSTSENVTIPVVLTVTASQQSLVLSQSGFFFQAVQGGSTQQTQTISVLNGGGGSLSFSATASTTSGGNWLAVSPTNGTATSSSAGSATVNIDSTGLVPGTYYGQIQFSATGAANSPQTTTVVLNVVSPAQSPGPSLSVTGVVLVQAAATTNSTRPLIIANPSPNPLNFSTSVSADSGTSFFTVSPANGSLTSGNPVTIAVQPATGLAAGVYTGNVTLIFTDPATQTVYQRRVVVALIVVPSGSITAQRNVSASALAPRAQSCAPTKLVLVATQLGNSFTVPVAWPAPLEVTAVDDCGSFMTQGSVISSFSNGDPPLVLASLQDGRWSGTWVPRSTSSTQVTITVQAQETAPPLSGSTQLGGTLETNPAVPVITANGVVSAASNTQRQPQAPGSYVAIYGQNLNPGSSAASAVPLPTQLNGTQAILGGKVLPLNYAGTGQINALIPFDAPVNTVQQLIVQQGSQLSAPEPVVISPTQPAIFTQDFSGQGYGVIVGYKADGSANFEIDASHPVSTGDVLVIYCTGLGPVDQPVPAGSAGPTSPLANVLNPVTATVGGQNAMVVFAGLAPTLTVYQVNLVVPSGVTPGASVPVVLSQSGQQSLPVLIAVQ